MTDRPRAPVRAARPAARRRRRESWRRSRTAATPQTATATAGSTTSTLIARLRSCRQRVDQRRHVEDVAQALAIGLEQDRERSEARRDRQQVVGLLALLPERRARSGAPLRQEQRAAGVLAKARREQRRAAELMQDQRFDFFRIGHQQLRVRRRFDVREAHHEPVVRPERLDVDAELAADLGGDGHAPGRVDAPAARRQHTDAPVAELVADALDDDRSRRRARRRARPGRARSATRFSAALGSRS